MEPFKATKLWNKIIQDFRSLMPIKRHRWRMRQYDSCFTTTEAVDWLHEYLQSSFDFGPWVTRNQAVSLLEKFVRSKVIQPVKVSKASKTRLWSDGFEDNGHLYRFVPVSPIKKLRSAFSSRSNLRNSPKASPDLPQKPVPKMRPLEEPTSSTTANATQTMTPQISDRIQPVHNPVNASQLRSPHPRPLGVRNETAFAKQNELSAKKVPQCTLVTRNLTSREIEDVWKSATLMRLQRLLWLSSLEGLLNADVINPKHLIHNCTRLSKGGVVLVSNKEQDLPHWVLSAMKCLARWPNQTDSSLPAYPGFERDVFKTIFNYFDTLPEPLLTYNLYPLVTEAFITAEHRDRGIAPPGYQEDVVPPRMSTTNGMFHSVENLMLNMTMGGYEDGMPTPGGYVNPTIATPHGVLESTRNMYTPCFETQPGIKERDRPICRRSVSAHLQTTPQIPTGFQHRRSSRHPMIGGEISCDQIGNKHGSSMSMTSLNDSHKQLSEGKVHRNVNNMSDILDNCRNEDRSSMRHRPNSKQGVLSKFNSESNIYHAGLFVAEHQHAGYQPRHFGSMDNIGNSDEPIPYMDDPCPKIIGRSPQSAAPSPIINSTADEDGSDQGTSALCPNTDGLNYHATGPSPTDSNNSKESAFAKLFRSSKRFGSAADLFQKILRKKSDSSLNRFHGGNLSRNSSTNQTPPYYCSQSNAPTCRSITNSAASNKSSGTETNNKISPSYPPPMRAILSMSQIVSSADTTPPEAPTSSCAQTSYRSTRSLNQTCPMRASNQAWTTTSTLDPFHQGLSKSSGNLRSSQHGLSDSHRVVSTHSLNRSEMSELGLTGSRQMKRSESTSSLYLNEDQSYMQESLKLCCLLLPPSNRRKLHLLLKLMSKIEQNEELQLSRTRSPRNLVLHTFTRCILRCRQEIDLNERLVMRMVEYLVDNHAAIFAVPQDLKSDVDERLVYLRRGKIKYTPDDMMNSPTYCVQVSVAEYKQQAIVTSQKAMEDLLESILKDNTIAAKNKRKKLKQFQKAYPVIYAKRMQPSASGVENVRPPSRCQKMTSEEFTSQATSKSQRALEDLLENIISSDRFSAKDKKKRLKKFQKEYPDIYRKRLPTNESEAQLFSVKPKIKQPMVNMRSLNRWKSIR